MFTPEMLANPCGRVVIQPGHGVALPLVNEHRRHAAV